MIRIGIIGDFDPQSKYHLATNDALYHASAYLSIDVNIVWLPTPSLDVPQLEIVLEPFNALWCAPGSPYVSMAGALKGIQFARERGRPFVGT
jgi:CTP synthase (UTP-ammonia lyase)